MYGVLLFLHSWMRWLVLLGAAAVLVRATLRINTPWDSSDERGVTLMLVFADIQLAIGLLLWMGLSPLTHLAFSEGLLFRGAAFTFFGLIHPTVMLIAVTWLHVGRIQLKRAASHRSWRFTVGTFLMLTLLAIPWPFWSFGRELFRLWSSTP